MAVSLSKSARWRKPSICENLLNPLELFVGPIHITTGTHVTGAFTGATTDSPGLLLRAIEEGRFLPMGADEDAASDFQLIAGTNRDLAAEVAAGRFREDLLARINLWTFRLPGLARRHEDIEPNRQYELEQYAARTGRKITINTEARRRFLGFATSPQAVWKANFRDLGGAVTRMATLAPGGRINVEIVESEIQRLESSWAVPSSGNVESLLAECLSPERLAALDRFDRAQLAEVLRICRNRATLSQAGRELFNVSRLQKKSSNDADRLRKYLSRFGLEWSDICRH